jgi:nitroimidazol reductase NimA-like FMN-containing flavoprotein (pyridoxamine 5'-phosphate oxidase superfamily)
VPTTDADRAQVPLRPDECLRLLRSAAIGRLAYTQSALPAVRPVTFTLEDGDVLIPAQAGSPLVSAVRGAVVAFQSDDYDLTARTGWTVTVVGPSRVLDGGAGECVIAVGLGMVRGWRTGRPHE